MGKRWKDRRLALVLIFVLAAALGIWLALRPGEPVGLAQAASLRLEPTQADSLGVDPGSQFLLRSSLPIAPSAVKQALNVEPQIAFRVQQEDAEGRVIRVKPEKPLQPGTIYRFSLAAAAGEPPSGWAFQTRDVFRVTGTLPRDRSAGVPANTGIEITFNNSNWGDPQGFWEISPAAEGRFERHKKTMVFVPRELRPATLYTVTLRKGFPVNGSKETLSGNLVIRFETAPAGGAAKLDMGFAQREFQVPVGETPALRAYYFQPGGGAPDIPVRVYRYPDARAYATALAAYDALPSFAYQARENYREVAANLPLVANFSTRLAELPQRGQFLAFPEPLDPGFYLVEAGEGEKARQAWLQVTDLSYFAGVSFATAVKGEALLWFNDLQDGRPAAGVQVEGAGQKAGSGPDGVARLELPTTGAGEEALPVLTARSPGGDEVVIWLAAAGSRPRRAAGEEEYETRQDYWHYLYLDRPLYRPGDAMHFWGVLQPRAENVRELQTVRAELTGERGEVLVAKEVRVEDGSFIDSLRLPPVLPGYYLLKVRSGDAVLVSQGAEVQTYTKPAYRLRVEADRRAVFAGEEVRFDVAASFFEGTPVPGLKLTGSFQGEQVQVTTDAEGRANLRLRVPYRGEHWLMDWAYLSLRAELPEAGEIEAGAGLMVFNSALALDSEVEAVGDGQVAVRAETRQVDLAGYNSAQSAPSRDYRGAPAAGRQVTGKVVEVHWNRVERGEYYDFINKTVQKLYDYRREELPVAEFSLATQGDGRGEYAFAGEKGKTYRIILETADDEGHVTQAEHSLTVPGDTASPSPYPYYRWGDDRENKRYRVGQEVALEVWVDEAPALQRVSGYLFYTARRGLQDVQVQDEPIFRVQFSAGDEPNLWAGGVYFDGRFYHPLWERPVVFDEQERRLTVEVRPDRESYRPGERVKLDVTVRDSLGKPVSARLNLNLVDEALYALRPEQADILQRLYGDYVPSGMQGRIWSHRALDGDGGGGAEQGGEGDAPRDDFRDTVFFGQVVTGADGKASAGFTLPDNLTSWRITAQAIASGVRAGTVTRSLPVRLPFFVDLVLNDTYRAGDRPVVVARANGQGLQPGEQVRFAARLEGPAAADLNASGAAFGQVSLALPVLAKAGEYRLTVRGETAGGLSDSLVVPLRVQDSFLQVRQAEYSLLRPDNAWPPPPGGGMTTLVFTNAERGQYLRPLRRLYWVGGVRVDQVLAREAAQRLLETYFGDKSEWGEEASLLRYQVPAGGIALLPYADADLETSAAAAALGEEAFDAAALNRYFRGVLEDAKESKARMAVALYGLSSLGEPVLLEATQLLREEDLEPLDKLYLGLALAEMGDLVPAREVLDDLLSSFREGAGVNLRLNMGQDRDETLQATARAAVLAAAAGHPDRDRLYGYVAENGPREYLTMLEQVAYLERVLPQTSAGAVSFAYQAGGRQERVSLQPGESFVLSLGKEIAKLQFSGVSGQVGVLAEQALPLQAGQVAEAGAGSRVRRSYSVVGCQGKEARPGDLLRVEITVSLAEKAPDGPYQVTDVLPAGLKPVLKPWRMVPERTGPISYPLRVNGQQVSFWYGRMPIVYYARVVTAGEYRAEGAVLQHARSGQVLALSPEERLKILAGR